MTIRISGHLSLLALIALSMACTAEPQPAAAPQPQPSQPTEPVFTDHSTLVLDFVNHPATTFAKLDIDVGLDARAAEAIVSWRAGDDGILLTSDDQAYTSLRELRQTPWVGAEALDLLTAYALHHAVLAADDHYGTVEGHPFTVEEAAATVAFTNRTGAWQLDVEVGLDTRAVDALVALRPLDTIEAIAAVPYIGHHAMGRLRDAAKSLRPLETCTSDDMCLVDEVCLGIPEDGTEAPGQCVPVDPLVGEGERCDSDEACSTGLICLFDDPASWGTCTPSWRWATFAPRPADDGVAFFVHGVGPTVQHLSLRTERLFGEVVLYAPNGELMLTTSAAEVDLEPTQPLDPNGTWTLVGDHEAVQSASLVLTTTW